MRKMVIFWGDIALLYGALALTLLIRYGTFAYGAHFADHLLPFTFIFAVWIFVFYLFNLYQYKFLRTALLFQTVMLASLVAGALSMALFYFFPGFFGLTPKVNLLIFILAAAALKYLWQHLVILRFFPQAAVPILVIGSSPLTMQMVRHLETHPHLGYRVAEWIKDPTPAFHEDVSRLAAQGVHVVIVHDQLIGAHGVAQSLYRLLPREVNIIPFSAFYEDIFERIPLDEIKEEWFIAHVSVHRPFYDRLKRMIDVVLAGALLVVLSPLMILTALAVLVSSRGPVVLKQRRMGKDGALFTMYKFRTMYHNSSGPLWTRHGKDPRVTPVGTVIRTAHLDELPQLVNIIRGDLSFIGPRPELEGLAEQYAALPYYDMRHIVKPGLTGWAQVNFKPSASLEEAKEKLCYDVYYIKNRSLFLDLMIAIRSVRYFFTNRR